MAKLILFSCLTLGSANFMAKQNGGGATGKKTPIESTIKIFDTAMHNMGYDDKTRKYWEDSLRSSVGVVEKIVVQLDNGSCHSIRTTVHNVMSDTIEHLFENENSPLKVFLDMIPTGGDPMGTTMLQTVLKLAENGLKNQADTLLEECGPVDKLEDQDDDIDDDVEFKSGLKGAVRVFKKALKRLNFMDEARVSEIVISLKTLIIRFEEFIADVADGSCDKIKDAMTKLGTKSLKVMETKLELLLKDVESIASLLPMLVPIMEGQLTQKLKARVDQIDCTSDDESLPHVEG